MTDNKDDVDLVPLFGLLQQHLSDPDAGWQWDDWTAQEAFDEIERQALAQRERADRLVRVLKECRQAIADQSEVVLFNDQGETLFDLIGYEIGDPVTWEEWEQRQALNGGDDG